MVCQKCGSSNVQAVSNTQGKIKKRGCLATLIHIILAICTCGLWLIVPLLMSGSKGKIKTNIEFVCLNCGSKVKG